MMTTYYSEQELEKFKQVSDVDLNELLQEVLEIEDRYYLEEKKVTYKKVFRKPVHKTYYTLLFNLCSSECQVINFCQDHKWSINCSVQKSYIHTLLRGFLNGHKTATRYTKVL